MYVYNKLKGKFMKTRSDITKKMLVEALETLLRDKPLNKISIQELVDQCGLNRQTFYYHFEDIFNLVEYSFEKGFMLSLYTYKGQALWQEGLKELLIELESNRIVYKHVLCDMSRDQLFNLFYKYISNLVVNAIDDIAKGQSIDLKYKENITLYFSISFGSIIEQWIFGRINQSVDELVDFLDTLIQDQIAGAVERLRKNSTNDR